MSSTKPLNEQEQQQWIKAQYQIAVKFLASKGLITESVYEGESRYLVPLMSVWKINLNDKSVVWVISGDLPTDYSEFSVAKDARDALRHFSFKWQMQADILLGTGDSEKERFGHYLVSRAEGLYDLFAKGELWQMEQS